MEQLFLLTICCLLTVVVPPSICLISDQSRPSVRTYTCNGARGGVVSIINLDPSGSLPFPDGQQGEYILFQNRLSQGLIESSEELDVTNEIIVVIHGLERKIERTYQTLIDELFIVNPNADIIFVDWLDAAGTTANHTIKHVYEKSASNARLVGGCLARWLEANRFFDASRAYCIGLGLGAHVCGFAGKTFSRQKWKRITALDPVEKEFSHGEVSRVARGDAHFVDVIHTSCLSFSYGIGHVDFFFNDLKKPQPGCRDDYISCAANAEKVPDIPNPVRKDSSSCSHIRSLRIFISSISEQCCLPLCSWQSTGYCRQAGYWSYYYPFDKVGNFYSNLSSTSDPFCGFRAPSPCYAYNKTVVRTPEPPTVVSRGEPSIWTRRWHDSITLAPTKQLNDLSTNAISSIHHHHQQQIGWWRTYYYFLALSPCLIAPMFLR